jgi:hypothetical protein
LTFSGSRVENDGESSAQSRSEDESWSAERT